MRLLVLFDVDGTLFVTDDPLVGQALRETLEERYAVTLADDAIARVDHAGQTSLRIARLVLDAAGIEAADLGAWCRAFAERYLRLLSTADTSAWQAAPGAEEALDRLAGAGLRLALLTGNPEPVARARMEKLGLARFFPAGQGAFGCEAESRVELIDLARARAGNYPREATVEVGDTPRDRSTAHDAGIHSLVPGASRLAGVADELLARAADRA